MKRLLVSLVLVCGLGTWAFADDLAVTLSDAPAVVNDAPETVSKVTQVVNALSPGFDSLYNLRDGTWTEGISSSLYNLTSNNYLLASVRAGYGHEQLIYSTLRLDLPGISRRFVPATIRGIATTGYLDLIWNAIGKYGTVGPWAGYQFESDDALAYGVALGGQVTF